MVAAEPAALFCCIRRDLVMDITKQTVEPLLTLRDASRRLNVKTYRLRYALDQHPVEPRQLAGIIRLWSADQIPALAASLARVGGTGARAEVR